MFERALAARAAAAVVVRLRDTAAGPTLDWALPALLSFLDDSAAPVRRLGALRPQKTAIVPRQTGLPACCKPHRLPAAAVGHKSCRARARRTSALRTRSVPQGTSADSHCI